MVFASTCDWFGIETRLYKCIDKSRRLTIRTIGTSVLFLWFGLSVTLRLSDRAFINSRICQGSTFKNWLKDFSGFVLGVATDPGVQSIPCGSLLVCNLGTLVFLKGHLMAIREAQGNLERPPSLLRLSISWTMIRQSWYVPVVVDSRLQKPYSSKAHSDQLRMVYVPIVRVSRCQLGIQRHQQHRQCITGICAVLRSGVATLSSVDDSTSNE